jgi:hypothetical protein
MMMQVGSLGDDVELRKVAEEAAEKLERVARVFDEQLISGLD